MKLNINFDEHINSLVDICDSIDETKITVLTGFNATGKSLIRKLLKSTFSEKLNDKKIIIPHSSQELRTSNVASLGALSSIANDVDWLSTSQQSISLIKKMINYDNFYVVIDEPEIGCSEELQLGIADYFNKNFDREKKGCLIITHSKIIVKNIVSDVFINIEKQTKNEWLNREINMVSLDDFIKFSDEMFINIRNRLNNNKK